MWISESVTTAQRLTSYRGARKSSPKRRRTSNGGVQISTVMHNENDVEVAAVSVCRIPVHNDAMEGIMIIGYARVSTDGQTLDNQQVSLRAAGADKIFSETVSGAITDRRQLAKAIDCLSEGDLLIVTKLDRLARSTRDLLNTLATISDKGAGFRVLDNPALDTTSAHGKLLLNILIDSR